MREEVIIRENGSKRVIHYPVGESLARQEMAAATDINNIMKKYQKTGDLTHLTKNLPWYGDVSEIGDFHDAILKIKQAESSFLDLPSRVRELFDNDPGNLIAFLQDPANEDKAVALGLAKKRKVEEPKAPKEPEENPSP